MLITFKQKNEQEQSADFNLQMTEAELSFLVNFAVESLIQIGAVAVQQNSTEPQHITLPISEAETPVIIPEEQKLN